MPTLIHRDIDHSERDQLVVSHIGLVKALAHRLAQRLPPQVEVPDLVSIGVLGLMDAASRYRAETGVPFDAFARRRVQGAMLDALRQLDWAPRSLRKRSRELEAALGRLRHELGREPSEQEIAAAIGLTLAGYGRALEQLRTLELGAVRSIENASGEGGLLDLCFDPDEGPELRLQRTELREQLVQAIQQLPPRERQILAMYYQQEMTLAEIGAVIGVGESRVSQLRSLAISRLRTSLRTPAPIVKARAA
jgi:RNA polymerase sigma factor FliA